MFCFGTVTSNYTHWLVEFGGNIDFYFTEVLPIIFC